MKGDIKTILLMLPASALIAFLLITYADSVNSYLGTTNASNLLLLLLVAVDLVVPLTIRQSEKQDNRRKLLLEHSGVLIGEAKSSWFQGRGTGMFGLNYEMTLGTVTYQPHGGSTTRFAEPKHFEQILEHLQQGYPQEYALLQEAQKATAKHLAKVITLWNELEERVMAEISSRCSTMTEWNQRGTMPMNAFALGPIVSQIYNEILFYASQGNPQNSFNISPTSSHDEDFFSFSFGSAQSLERSALEELSRIAYETRDDSLGKFRAIEADRVDVDKKVKSFKESFDTIADDFEYGHIGLRGRCSRCVQLGEIA